MVEHMTERTRLLTCIVFLSWAVACKSKIVSCNNCQPSAIVQTCQVTEVSQPPWSTNETTAPPPKWEQLDWYFYENSDHTLGIALNASWSQNAAVIDQYVDGYYLNIGKRGLVGSYKLHFTLRNLPLVSQDEDALFRFECFGHNGDPEIIAGDRLYVTLHALPMYQAKTANQGYEVRLVIPDCDEHPRMMSTEYCKTNSGEYNDYYEENNHLNTPKNSKYSTSDANLFKLLLAAAGVGAAVALLVCGIYTLFKYLYRRSFAKKGCTRIQNTNTYNGSCLIIVSSSSGEMYCKATNILADILKLEGLEVTCNLWEHIGMRDPIVWTNDRLSSFPLIVLVCTPTGKGKWECNRTSTYPFTDPFAIGMDTLCSKMVSRSCRKFSVVYFDEDPSTCVPEQVLKVFDCFKLTEQFGRFLKHLTCSSPHSSDAQHLIANLGKVTNEIHADNTRRNFCRNNILPERTPLTNACDDDMDCGKASGPCSFHSGCNPPYDSGISGSSTNYCNYNSVSSCEGSQCSCHNLSNPTG